MHDVSMSLVDVSGYRWECPAGCLEEGGGILNSVFFHGTVIKMG